MGNSSFITVLKVLCFQHYAWTVAYPKVLEYCRHGCIKDGPRPYYCQVPGSPDVAGRVDSEGPHVFTARSGAACVFQLNSGVRGRRESIWMSAFLGLS